jgi:MYXO-CTERM domain-containing protein
MGIPRGRRRLATSLLAVGSFLALPAWSSATITYYNDDFDTDHTANWTVNKSVAPNANDANSHSNFFFDYSTVGVPSATNSVGGTTRGLRLDANTAGGIFSGLSVSPNGQSFSGDYRLHFDMWLNFIGPAPAGGSGSTQAAGGGVETAGTTSQWAGGTQDSVHFSTTLDGNSSVDWRAYSSAAPTGYTAPSGVFAAGTGTSPDARNNSHPYYASFGGKTPPAAQTTLFPTQTGSTLVGSAGFEWADVVIDKIGNLATWTVDGKLIATVDTTSVTHGGHNILLNYYDTNAGSSTDTTGMNFALFDNVRVEETPEPASLSLLAVAGLGALRRRRR